MPDTDDLPLLRYLEGERDKTIYETIGLEPIINCRGTFTILGGSIMRPEALGAFEAASGYFAQLDELAEAVGRRLAALTGAEWGLIANGCAAAIKHVTTACVTGGNPERLLRVPDLTGFEKRQVIVPRYSRNQYDQAVRTVGVEIVEVETPAELEHAINPTTAMIYLVTGAGSAPGQPLSLEVIADIARPHDIPILADSAAELLTIPNVHLEQGATVVAYSGGKAICGPQSAGIALGRKDLLQASWQASAPHHGHGRDNKIGKEETLAMLAAVEAWIARDHAGEWQIWLERLERIAGGVADIPTVATAVEEPTGLGNKAPGLVISWAPDQLHLTAEEVAEDFARNRPRIAVGSADADGRASIRINPSQMRPEQERILIERIRGALTAERQPRPAGLEPAAFAIGGEWMVDVTYFTSSSRHRWMLRQDGNWIGGRHESDLSVQEITGTLESNRLMLRSDTRQAPDNVAFMFSGTVSADRIEGSILLGEYLTATFCAAPVVSDGVRERVVIPKGPPLAT